MFLFAACGLVGCQQESASTAATTPRMGRQRIYIEPRMAADPNVPPFSRGVQVGDTLYLSGAIGIDDNQKVPESVEDEAKAVLNSVQSVLVQAGMTMDDLVYVQVFCSDVVHYDVFNRVYRTYFKREFPARAFLGSGPLLFGARFEVQGIAVQRTAAE